MLVKTQPEIEMKLLITRPGQAEKVPGYLARHGWLVTEKGRRQVKDHYFDTPDRLLYQAGVACRLRLTGRAAELSLKSLEPPIEGMATRVEMTERLPAAPRIIGRQLPGKTIVARLRRLFGTFEIEPLFTLVQQRRIFNAHHPTSGLKMEVSLDLVAVQGFPRQLSVVELELQEGDPAVLRQTGAQLIRFLDCAPFPPTKLGFGLETAGVRLPPLPPDTLKLRADDRFSDAVYRILKVQYDLLCWNVPGARLGINAEKLHDLRVAGRRLAFALRSFAEVLPEKPVKGFERDLKWVLRHLGAVRDLDVYLTQLADDRRQADPANYEALDFYIRMVTLQRHHEQQQLLRVFVSARFTTFLARLGRFISSAAIAPDQQPLAEAGVTAVVPDLLRRSLRKTLKRGRAITRDASPEDLHDLRRRCRKLRYLCEFLREVYGKPLRKVLRRAEACQDALGMHQDAVVGAELIRRFREERLAGNRPRRALGAALDQLARQRMDRALQGQTFFRKAWRRFDRARVYQRALACLKEARRTSRNVPK